jgi:hypothetical protein
MQRHWIVGAFVLTTVLASRGAGAETETWKCAYLPPNPAIWSFVVHEGKISGWMGKNYETFDVVKNNEHLLVGLRVSLEFDSFLKRDVAYAWALAIDKSSGEFTMRAVVADAKAPSGNAPPVRWTLSCAKE